MKTLKYPLLTALLLLGHLSWSQVAIGDVAPGKIAGAAFTLQQPGKVKISGHAGAFYEDWKMLVYYGWIIDAETRKVVWHMYDKADLDRNRFEFGEVEFNNEVTLSKGNYEAYFTGAYHQRDNDNWNSGFTSVMDYVFSDRDHIKFKNSIQEYLGMKVTGESIVKLNTANLINDKISGAVVSILKPGHNANIKKGFSLSAPATLKIYAIGEGVRNEFYDYAWIYDLDKRQRVWEMDFGNTDFAGGGEKNVSVNEKLTLPAGNYLVNYVTDDSHDFNDWNVMPPDDPQFIGITVWADTDKDKKNIIPFRMPEEIKPVLQLTHIRDNDYKSQGIVVKSDVDLRILCLGEEGSDREMADYGWIMNAKTHDVVWDMNNEMTDHAGGAKKNRMSDKTIKLTKGDYIVYYTSDDSHSYEDWNSGPPHEQDYYGITLWVTKKEDLSKVQLFDPASFKNDKALVEIVRVRDDEYLNESFNLSEDTKVRVIALGEGVNGRMVDYGWIKNMETGKVVWEMTYRNTEDAGGDRKNRLYNDTIILSKGTYRIFYETDDSHSYRRWNASPPHNQEKYGISLYAENRVSSK